jgi:hypothetical protein
LDRPRPVGSPLDQTKFSENKKTQFAQKFCTINEMLSVECMVNVKQNSYGFDSIVTYTSLFKIALIPLPKLHCFYRLANKIGAPSFAYAAYEAPTFDTQQNATKRNNLKLYFLGYCNANTK